MSYAELLKGFDVIRRIIEGMYCHIPNYWRDYIFKTRPFFQNVNFGQNVNQKGTLIFLFSTNPAVVYFSGLRGLFS